VTYGSAVYFDVDDVDSLCETFRKSGLERAELGSTASSIRGFWMREARLKRENAKLRQERDFLEDAAVFFAKESK